MDAPTRTLLEVAEQSNPPGPDLPLPPFEEFREITKPLVKMMEKLVTGSDEGFNVYSPPFLFYKLEMSRLIEDCMGRRILQLASIFCKSPLIAKAIMTLATSKEIAAALTAVASSSEAGVVIASLSSSAKAVSAMISLTSCQDVATGISAIAASPDAAVAMSGLVALPNMAAAMAQITSSLTATSALSMMASLPTVRAAMAAIGSSLTLSSAVATIASSNEAISALATLLSLPDSARVISAMASSPETTLAALTSSPVEPANIAAITSSPDASQALATIALLPEATAAALTAMLSSPEVVAVMTQSPKEIVAIFTALVLSSNSCEVATSSSVSKNVVSVLKEIASLPKLSAAIAAIISSPEGVLALAALISSRDVAVAMEKMASSSKAAAVMDAVASSPEASVAMAAIASSHKAAAALSTMSSVPEWVNLLTAVASSPESISMVVALSCSPGVGAAMKSILSTPGLAEAVMMVMTSSADAANALATGTPEAAISTIMAKAASHQDKIDPSRRAERQETCLNSAQQDTIDRLLSFTHTEVRESFVRVLDIFQGTESDAVLEQFQIVLGFLQSGGLTRVREQIRKSTAHLIEIGFMFQFIGVYGLDVQRKLMIEFPQIANLLTKFSTECYSVKSCLSYFSHYSIVQECLLRNGTLPSVVDDDDTLAGLILTDNRKIRNELMACNVSVDNPFVDAILKSKSATEDWKECCDKVAAHRRIAGECCDNLLARSSTTVPSAPSATSHTTTTNTSTSVDSGVLAELAAVANTAAGGASINGATTTTSSKTSTLSQYLQALYSNKCLGSVNMIREECERQTSYIIRSCLLDMMGRYFRISDQQKLNSSTMYEEDDDDFSCCNAVDRMIFKSKLSQRVCYPALLAHSPVSRYRNFAVTTTQLLLDQSLINGFPLFTRLSEWAPLKKTIPPWICSSNAELAANAREFVLKQNLPVPSLKSICLLKVSEYILQVQTQLHHLPYSLLKQLTPCTIE